MNAITEATEAVETMPPLRFTPDSFMDADFYTRMSVKGLALREVAPLSLFVQSERNFPDESTTSHPR